MNDSTGPDWVQAGTGKTPRHRWGFHTEADLVGMAFAREAGLTFAADASGSLYSLDRAGQLVHVSRSFNDVARIVWSETGTTGAVLLGDDEVSRIDERFDVIWSATLPGQVMSMALDPFGHHLAIALASRRTLVFDWRNKRIAEFETMRPLSFMQFCATDTQLVAAAKHGHLCCHNLDGTEVWNQRFYSNVGDLRITGNAGTILVCGYNHGVQLYDAEGTHRGSYMVEGTPKLAACTFIPESVAVATIEKHLYWLDSDGEMKWATQPDVDVIGLECDPLGSGLIAGLQDGHLLRLSWDDAPPASANERQSGLS